MMAGAFDLLNLTVPAVGPEESLQSLLDQSNRTEWSNPDADLMEETSAANPALRAEATSAANLSDISIEISGSLDDSHADHNGFFGLAFGLVSLLGPFGYAIMKAGMAQRKNAIRHAAKPLIQLCACCITFWAVGCAFAVGSGNEYIGLENFFFSELDTHHFPQWFFQCCTCLYCASIASAGGFERNRLRTDLATAVLVASLLYPLPVHWCWHEQGFLAKRGFLDYAGGGVIHAVGGASSFVLSWLSKPRHFDASAGFLSKRSVRRSGHNVIVASIGGLFAVLGSLAIQLGAGGDHYPQIYHTRLLSIVMLNSVLAMSGAGLGTLFLSRLIVKQWSVYRVIGGMLAGLVLVSPGTDCYHPATVLALSAALAPLLHVGARNLLLRLSSDIDDPLDVFATHLVPGLVGLILVPVLNSQTGFVISPTRRQGWVIAFNLAGGFILVFWSGMVSFFVFGSLGACERLARSFESQIEGSNGCMREDYLHEHCGLHGIVSDGGGMAKNRAAAGDHLSATFTAPPPLRPILKRVGASTSFLPSAANTSSQHSLCNTKRTLNLGDIGAPTMASTAAVPLKLPPRLVVEQPDEAIGGVGDGERTPLTPTRSAPVYSGQKAAAAAQNGPTESGDRLGETEKVFKRPLPGLVAPPLEERARKRTVFQLLTESARKTLRGNKQPRQTTNVSLRRTPTMSSTSSELEARNRALERLDEGEGGPRTPTEKVKLTVR